MKISEIVRVPSGPHTNKEAVSETETASFIFAIHNDDIVAEHLTRLLSVTLPASHYGQYIFTDERSMHSDSYAYLEYVFHF